MSSKVLRRRDIFRYRPFLLYFTGYSVSKIGTGMQFIGNSWLALQLTNSPSSVAFVLVAASLPGLLLSPLIGIYVDRFDRKYLAASMDLFRALSVLSIPILWWLGLLQPWHLYLMSFLVALGDEVYTPSSMGLIREVVPPEMLLYANSTTTISMQLGLFLGAGLGGIIIALFSPIIIMIVNAVSFVVSASCILSMRKAYVSPRIAVAKTKGFKQFVDDLRAGLTYIGENKHIIVKYLMMLFIRSTLYTINVLLAPFTKDVLKVGSQGFGYVDASFAIGAIVGNLLLPRVTLRYGNTRTMTAGMWGIGASLLFFALAQNLVSALIGYFFLGVTFQVGVLYLTKAQESTDVNYQGRVYSTFNTFFALASFLIYLSMGFLGALISLRWLYGSQVVLLGIAGVIAYIWIYRKEKSQMPPDAVQLEVSEKEAAQPKAGG